MPGTVYQFVQDIKIGSNSYQLVMPENEKLAYMREYIDEAPWLKGVPVQESEPTSTWHQGGFKSRQGVPGTSEYGINTDGRWPFRLAPGPKINTLTLPGSAAPPSYVRVDYGSMEFNGGSVGLSDPHVLIVAGTRLFAVSALGVVFLIYQAGPSNPRMALTWQGRIYMCTVAGVLYEMDDISANSLMTGAGTTTQWTPSAGANWQNIDDAVGTPDDDATYNVSSTTGHIDLFTKAAVGMFDGSALTVLSHNIRYRRTGTGGTTPIIDFVCRVGGVNYFAGVNWPLENDTSYHDLSTNGFQTNPATGQAWTEAELDAAEFGYQLVTAPSVGLVRITQFYNSISGYTWTTVDAVADWLAVGPRRLFKVSDSGSTLTLKNIVPGLDSTTEANWGDEVIVPGTALAGNEPLVAYQKTAIVASNYGVHGVDEDGTGIRILDRIAEPIKTMMVFDPYLYISHNQGLTRWIPGDAEECGLQKEILNESGITGVIQAMASIGKWLYAVINPPSGNTHVIVGRDREPGEPALGPMIWDTLIETGEDVVYTALASGLFWTSYALGFPQGNNLGYVTFPASGGTPDIDASGYQFVLTGTRFTYKYRFNNWHQKDFLKVDIVGKGCTASIFWNVAYSIDGAAYVSLGDVNADGLFTFVLASTATGREVKFRFTYTSNNASAKGEIVFFEPYVVPQSKKVPGIRFFLRLDYGQSQMLGWEERLPNTQLATLYGLTEAAGVSESDGPWGENVNLYLKSVKVVDTQFTGLDQPRYVVEVSALERETS